MDSDRQMEPRGGSNLLSGRERIMTERVPLHSSVPRSCLVLGSAIVRVFGLAPVYLRTVCMSTAVQKLPQHMPT